MKRAVIILSALLVVLLAAGGVGAWFLTRPEPRESSFLVRGSIAVPHDWMSYVLDGVDPDDLPGIGGRCVPEEGYEDIREGAQVVVKDESGRTVGVGELGAPTVQPEEGIEDREGVEDPKDPPLVLTDCAYPFTVTMTPDSSQFYSVRIGDATRESTEVSEAKLRKPVRVSIG